MLFGLKMLMVTAMLMISIIFAAWALNSFHLWLEASTELEQIGTIILDFFLVPEPASLELVCEEVP